MKNYTAIKAKLRAAGIDFEENEPMYAHTSFHIGGAAALFVIPCDEEQLQTAWRLTLESGLPHHVVGKGTNLLVGDAGIDAVVLCLDGGCDEIYPCGDLLQCGAGASLTRVCRAAAAGSLSGLEFAYGIPGSVGGAVYMNAGAYGGEMRDVLQSVTFLDETGALCTLPAEELALSYRHSLFTERDCCIVHAVLGLYAGEKEEIIARMEETMQKRKAKQPLEFPSAGSTFKRPEGNYASALIEQCGLKGRRVGGACVSEKHAGFIVNAGGATAQDVLELVREVQAVVKEKTGYALECEIKQL